MKENTFKNVIVIAVIAILFIGVFLLVRHFSSEDASDEEFLKDYKINEYIPTYISDESMAKIYLNDYIYNMYNNVEAAYNSLDVEYRNAKFGNLENYKAYVNSLNYSTYKLSKYYVKEVKEYKFFGVYDENENLYIFKTNGVMQYTVYLDDYTVEI